MPTKQTKDASPNQKSSIHALPTISKTLLFYDITARHSGIDLVIQRKSVIKAPIIRIEGDDFE